MPFGNTIWEARFPNGKPIWKNGNVLQKNGEAKRDMIRVVVWYEYSQESGELRRDLVNPDMSNEDYQKFNGYIKENRQQILQVYPKGLMHPLLEELRQDPQIQVVYKTLYDPDYGIPQELLEQTDVLIWWAHIAHDAIPDALAERIAERIQMGMGFIALHSAHKSKPFMRILGTSGTLKWREGDFCRIWNICPTHPIAAGIPEMIELSEEEMYGEVFDIPKPDDVVFLSWFRGGEVFRSGCTWSRGYGRVFYFQPGHETSPSYNHPHILQIIRNAVHWAAPVLWRDQLNCPNVVNSPEAECRNAERRNVEF